MPVRLAVLNDERLGSMIDDDLDFFRLGVFEFPLGSLEELTRLARHDFHVFRAEPQGTAAAIHRRIADTDDQNLLADLVDVAERDGFEPGNADMNAVGIVAAGQLEFLALGRARAYEHGVELFGLQQLPHALDGRIQAQVRAHVDDVADFLVEHLRGKPECRNIGAHQSAGHGVLFKDGDLIAQAATNHWPP